MRVRSLSWVPSLLLAGCAVPGEVSTPTAAAPLAVADASEVDLVVDLADQPDTRTVCRREAPTGSRISNTTCRSTEPTDVAAENVREQLVRQEVMDTVQQRQIALDQQRQMMRQQ